MEGGEGERGGENGRVKRKKVELGRGDSEEVKVKRGWEEMKVRDGRR